jgi:hypothetical protein
LAKACFVHKEVCNVLRLLTNIRTLILTVLVNELKLFQRFDDINIIPEVDDDVFRASMKKVVENGEALGVDSEAWVGAAHD